MALNSQRCLMSEQDYLEGERLSAIRHEYIDGDVYAMAGASANHNRITTNLARNFGNHLENTPCEPFSSDMKVKAGNDFFIPMSSSLVITKIAKPVTRNRRSSSSK